MARLPGSPLSRRTSAALSAAAVLAGLTLAAAPAATAAPSPGESAPATAAPGASAATTGASASFSSTPLYANSFDGPGLGGGWGIYDAPTSTRAKSKANVVVHDGMVSFKTAWDATLQKYTTGGGCLCSVVQTYGKYEMRVRVSAGNSRVVALLWPTQGWPPEIDIMEMGGAGVQGTRQTNTQTMHWDPANLMIHTDYNADMTQWHDVGVEWSPGVLRYTLDGQVTDSIVSPNVPSKDMWFGLQTAFMTNRLGTMPVSMDMDSLKIYSYTGGPVYAPGAPSAATAVAGDTSASVSWQPPASDGNSQLSKYTITASPGGATTTVPGVKGALPPTSATFTGLTPGTTYTYAVSASNSFGTSANSDSSNAVTVTGAPPTVTAPRVDPVTRQTIGTGGQLASKVSWTGTAGSSAICSNEAQRSTDGVTFSAFGPQYKSRTYVTDTAAPGSTITYRARQTGCNGLVSPWATTSSSYNALNDNDAAITYTGTWTSANCASCTGGTMHRTAAKAAAAAVTVNGGQRVGLVATVGSTTGAVNIYVDGVKTAGIWTHATSTANRKLMWTSPVLASGSHTVSFVNGYTGGSPGFDLDGVLTLS